MDRWGYLGEQQIERLYVTLVRILESAVMYTNLSDVWIGGVKPSVSQTRRQVQTK